MADTELPVDVQVDSSQLPLCTNDDGEQVIRMFWIDAYEDYYKQPGILTTCHFTIFSTAIIILHCYLLLRLCKNKELYYFFSQIDAAYVIM